MIQVGTPRTFRRLIVAVASSLFCLFGTLLFNGLTGNNSNHRVHHQPIARLTALTREASSRSSDDVIWHTIEMNEDLFSGDYIRTGVNSAATIEFLQQKARVDVDQSSMILIEETDGSSGVNFIDGRLLVNADKVGKGSISVRAGNEKMDLAASSVSLNKGKKGEVDVALVSGSLDNVKMDSNSKMMQKIESKIRTLMPQPNQLILRTETDSDQTIFSWAPEVGLQDAITLQVGNSSSSLTTVATAKADAGQIKVRVSAGDHFWRLVAGQRESPLLKLSVKVLPPARLLLPRKQASLTVSAAVDSSTPIHFSWSQEPEWTNAQLEIAEDPQFRQPQKLNVSNKDSADVTLSAGKKFFWRLVSSLDAEHSSISETFMFNTTAREEILALDLLRPYDHENFSSSAVETSGVRFTWKAVDSDAHYTLNLKELVTGQKQTISSASNRWTLPSLAAGKYEWSVSAVGPAGTTLVTSPVRTFEVQQLAPLAFKNLRNEIYYSTDHPNLAVEWERGPSEAQEWHVRISNKNSAGDLLRVSTHEPSLVKALPQAGMYDVEVEAVNQNGDLVAKSDRVSILFKQAPLIPAPQLDDLAVIKADPQGAFSLAWKSVPGASEYVVLLKSESGEVVQRNHFSSNSAQLRKIHPGSYVVTVRGVDRDGHDGIESQPRSVLVDALGGIEAPKHRKVSFDDD